MGYDGYAPDLFDAVDVADGAALPDGAAGSAAAERFDLTGPPRRPVRARRPLTPQSLVERADLVPHTAEAETVLRIYRRRREQHAALYVAEMQDLASLWTEDDDGDEKALNALGAAAGLRTKLGRGENRLRDAHVAVTDLPACFARVGAGELPVDWFEWLLRSVLRLTAHQRRQVDERVAAWQLEAIDVERFYRELRLLIGWFGRTAVQETPQEQRGVFVRASEDGDGTACLSVVGPAPEILALGQRLDAAARAVQDAQRRALESGTAVPFDLDGEAVAHGRHLSLSALRYAILTRTALGTGSIEVPEPAFRLSVVVPVLSLLGLSHAPATLDGTIPVPARMARELVAKAPAFERVLADAATGEYHHAASKTYPVSRAMAENLRLIDPVCALPGCSRNVMTVGESDHIEEFDHEHPARGGPTEIGNLHRLCRIHHRMKTAGLLDPERDESTGVTRWRIGDLAVCDARTGGDLVTRELAEQLEAAWDRYLTDQQLEAMERQGEFAETEQDRADHAEEMRWGEHVMEYWSRPDTGGPDDPGPPGLDPRDGVGPPPF